MHVVQRGVNCCAIFQDEEDRHHFHPLLRLACEHFGMWIHAFVFMDNHVHLLVWSNQVGVVQVSTSTWVARPIR